MKTAIIVPTIREESIKKFLDRWSFDENTRLLIVEDNPKKTFKIDKFTKGGAVIEHFSWEDIDRDLGKDSWIIPRRTDCVRSYGFYKAFKDPCGYETFITLDDDCYPLYDEYKFGFVEDHWTMLAMKFPKWVWTTKKHKSRGVPHQNIGERSNVINMGFWNGVADLDAISQLLLGSIDLDPKKMRPVPAGVFYPMCGMNLSFKRIALPLMYFLLMGKEWEYDRLGDIWAGIISKKICDHFDFTVTSGSPPVLHSRASNVWSNLKKEYPGMEINENFWHIIDNIKLEGTVVTDCYLQIAEGLPQNDEYFVKLSEAMKIWIKIL